MKQNENTNERRQSWTGKEEEARGTTIGTELLEFHVCSAR